MKTWMANMGKKLRSQAGESLGETLLSMLVAALALTMLAGAVGAGGHIVTSSRQKLSSYYNGANSVAQMSGNGTLGAVTIEGGHLSGTVSGRTITGGTFTQNQSIQLYSNNERIGNSRVAAYKISGTSSS